MAKTTKTFRKRETTSRSASPQYTWEYVLLALTVEGFLGPASGSIPHPLSYSLMRQEHWEAISSMGWIAYCTLCWLPVSPGNCFQVWAILGCYFPGLKFLWQYYSLETLVWFLSLAFYQLIRSCQVMVLQSRIRTGYYCLLAIDDLPSFTP